MTHSMVAGRSSGQGPASAEDKQGLRLEVRESETWMCVRAAWRSPPAPISEVLRPLCPGLTGHEGNMSEMSVLGGRRGSEEGAPSRVLRGVGSKAGVQPFHQGQELVIIPITALTVVPLNLKPTHTW